jgi:hypothetical protein
MGNSSAAYSTSRTVLRGREVRKGLPLPDHLTGLAFTVSMSSTVTKARAAGELYVRVRHEVADVAVLKPMERTAKQSTR